MEANFSEEMKQAVEALLFVAGEPLTTEALAEYTEADKNTVSAVIAVLVEEYRNRGFSLIEIAGGWQFMTAPQLHAYIQRLYQPKVHRLSRAAMETLAIIAYCQPMTRSEIEEIRGVNADGIVSGLLEKGFLDEVGRKDTPGKPVLYGTNGRFLELLGLKSLAELPRIDESAFQKEQKLFEEETSQEEEPRLFDAEPSFSMEESREGVTEIEV